MTSRIKTRVATALDEAAGTKQAAAVALIISLVLIWSDSRYLGTMPQSVIKEVHAGSPYTCTVYLCLTIKHSLDIHWAQV